MTRKVIVLALDAADYRLATEWGCDNILLNSSESIKTDTYSRHHPYTLDIWPTVATGLHPEEHGMGENTHTISFENRLLNLGTKIRYFIPQSIREKIGRYLIAGTETYTYDFPRLDEPNVFDDAFSWVGISEAENLAKSWKIWHQIHDDDISEIDLRRQLQILTYEGLVWAETIPHSGLYGVHLHSLDVAGHLYSTDESKLKEYYCLVDDMIGDLRERLTPGTDIIILSDHGMQVAWLDDESPGDHSWHPLISSTMTSLDFPDHIYDVYEFLQQIKPKHEKLKNKTLSLTDEQEDQLRNLGYL